MNKKYELTDISINLFGITLYRIKALISFGTVKAGELGGYIEREENLNQSGDAWVSGDACVSGRACVSGDACVSGRARVTGDAWVSDRARVTDDAWVSDRARVTDDACVSGDAWVSDRARVTDDAWVTGDACVSGRASVTGDAWVTGHASVTGDAWVIGTTSYVCAGPLGSRDDFVTAFTCNDQKIRVKCGCFYGSLGDFEDKVKSTHGDNTYGRSYLAFINMVKIVLGDN